MTEADVDVILSRSPGKNSSPWKDHYAEMGKKTVIRRIAKYLPMSVQKAAAIDEAVERGHYTSVDAHGEVTIEAAPAVISGTLQRRRQRDDFRPDPF